jgi:hypothetical protein
MPSQGPTRFDFQLMNCSWVTLYVEFKICFTVSEQVTPYLVISFVSQGRGTQICFSKLQKASIVATLTSPVDTWYSSATALQSRN